MLKSTLNRAARILSVLILLAACLDIVVRAQTAALPAPIDTAAVSNAANLIQAATVSIAAKNLDGAKAQLDQAQALSPDQKLYWATSGNLLLRRNQNQEALAAFRKELALFPGETAMYRSIVDRQFALQQRKDAMATLHAWFVADSTDPLPARKLVALLVEDGDAAAAVKEGKDDLLRLPEEERNDERLQTELGRAEILSGDKASGIKRIHALLASTGNLAADDNATYVLADAGVDLAFAEKISRENINELATKGSTWALGGDAPAMRNLRDSTTTLNSAWDTLGWTLFREGKPQEARSYLSAAWQGLLLPEVGEHLAEVQEALGNKDEALRMYQLALAAVEPDDNLRARKALAIKPADVQTRVQTLRRSGATANVADPAAELLLLRTIPLGSHTGPNQRLNYTLLVRDGKVVDVQSRTARAVEGAAEMFARVDLASYFPASSKGTLVRVGEIACRAGSCAIALVAPEPQ